MINNIYILGFLSFLISFLSIPLIIKLSSKYGLFDYICDRKIHNGNISRLGGLGVFLGFLPVVVSMFTGDVYNDVQYFLIAAMVIAFLSGFIDDLVHIRARYKFLMQIAAASLVACSGLLIEDLRIYTFLHVEFGFFSYILTIVWIVAFMNAVNLIDGMDGLSTGVVLIANFFVIIIAIINHSYPVLSIAVVLELSILGFYIFNFPPAKIFLGDGGAYFIGFVYAIMPFMGLKKSAALTVFLIPMILMLIPVTDIAIVMYRRLKSGRNVFYPDNNHLHHRLMNVGFSTKRILLIIYSYTVILGCFALFMVVAKPEYTMILLSLAVFFVLLSFYMLHGAEKKIESLEAEKKILTEIVDKNKNVKFLSSFIKKVI